MTRTLIVAVLSAIAASLTAFLVISRWQLAGTLTGAVLFPFIFSLVSFWSRESLERAGKWARRRVEFDEAQDVATELPATEQPGSDASDANVAGDGSTGDEGRKEEPDFDTGDLTPRRGVPKLQWLLVGFAVVALAVSIYALTSVDPAQKVIVQERVVEKTVTVTTQVQTSGLENLAMAEQPATPAPTEAATGGSLSTTTSSAVAKDQTTTTAATVDPEEEPPGKASSTTTTSEDTGQSPGGTTPDTDATNQQDEPPPSAP